MFEHLTKKSLNEHNEINVTYIEHLFNDNLYS